MNQPLGYPVTPPPKSKAPAWKVGGATILSFVALLYLIELVDQLTGHSLDRNGIRPLETDGLWGILFAPLLHGELGSTCCQHRAGAGARLPGDAGRDVAVRLGHRDHLDPRRAGHLADRQHRLLRLETNHIGASGLIFGWLTFLLVFGWLTRHIW